MVIKYLPLYLLIVGMAVSIPLTDLETRGFILDLFGGLIGGHSSTTTTTTTKATTTTATTTTTTSELVIDNIGGGFFGFGFGK